VIRATNVRSVTFPAELSRHPERPGRGRSEGWSLHLVDPYRPRGLWIRHSGTAARDGTARGRWWCAFAAGEAAAPVTVHREAAEVTGVPLDGHPCPAGSLSGTAASGGREVEWDLRCRSGEPPLTHLPRGRLDPARLSHAALASPSPAAVFDGELRIDGERIGVHGWAGAVEHHRAGEHAARRLWLHGSGFTGVERDTWLDLAVARPRLGPAALPWVAGGALSMSGHRLPLGGPGHRVTVAEVDGGYRLLLPSRRSTVEIHAAATTPGCLVEDDGAPHPVLTCPVADVRVRVERPHRAPVVLTAVGGGGFELDRGADQVPPLSQRVRGARTAS
jgi:hypothetical protein